MPEAKRLRNQRNYQARKRRAMGWTSGTPETTNPLTSQAYDTTSDASDVEPAEKPSEAPRIDPDDFGGTWLVSRLREIVAASIEGLDVIDGHFK
jgi:hypothetical protein